MVGKAGQKRRWEIGHVESCGTREENISREASTLWSSLQSLRRQGETAIPLLGHDEIRATRRLSVVKEEFFSSNRCVLISVL